MPWPLILIEGPEKSGKSWAAAELSASEKVGQTYWIDIGEGAADEYGAIPGARYLVVEHDGSFNEILSAVEQIKALAQQAQDGNEPPVVLVIDSGTAEWELLKDLASVRASTSDSNRARLKRDPNAEVRVPMNLWNDATAKHRKLMTLLLTFPGIAVMTARGKEVAAMEDGKPVEGAKEYKVEGHKTLGFDATVWVRLSRDHAPVVVGCRSVHHGIRPGVDEAKPIQDFSLGWLVFDYLKCDPATSHARDLPTGELANAKQRVWELAQRLGWNVQQLSAAYEKAQGHAIGEATPEQLDEYCGVLQAEIEQAEAA